MGKTIVIGVTSSIAAFKTLELTVLLRQKGYGVHVIMTPKAAQMIAPAEFEKVSNNKVFVDFFEEQFDYKKTLRKKEVEHITVAQKADVFVVVPATANTIAEIAQGSARNFLTTSILATKAPIIICPAMNTFMWENQATQKNLTTLRSYGYHIVEPTSGMLACGYEGKGKLENIPIILEVIENVLANRNRLKGKRILITAGATKEKIDDVRFITNNSSGKMGVAIAEAAYRQGAEVLLLRSNSSVKPSYPIRESVFESPEDLGKLLEKTIKQFDYVFHTAAVGDFAVKNYKQGKLSSNKPTSILLSPQKKLISLIKKSNSQIKLFGFKAEYGVSEKELIARAVKKLQETNAAAIIANDVSKKESGFGSDSNEVYVVFSNGKYQLIPYASKKEIAEKILALVFPEK